MAEDSLTSIMTQISEFKTSKKSRLLWYVEDPTKPKAKAPFKEKDSTPKFLYEEKLAGENPEEKLKVQRKRYQFVTGKPDKGLFAKAAEMVLAGAKSPEIGLLLKDKFNERLEKIEDKLGRNKLSITDYKYAHTTPFQNIMLFFVMCISNFNLSASSINL